MAKKCWNICRKVKKARGKGKKKKCWRVCPGKKRGKKRGKRKSR